MSDQPCERCVIVPTPGGKCLCRSVVERLDSYPQERHAAELDAARERLASRRAARGDRAKAAARRLRGDA